MDKNINLKFLFSYLVLTSIICSQSNFLNAQDELLRHITIKADGYCHLFYVPYSIKKVNVEDDVTYYWFANGEVHQNTGGYSGQLLQSIYQKTTFGGSLIEKGTFKNGVKDGVWKIWDLDGNLVKIENWKKGFKDGKAYIIDPVAEKEVITGYKDDQKHGWELQFQNDSLIMKERFKHGVKIDSDRHFLFFHKNQ
ncbi:MAG: hypothetical protein JXR69_03045 [Candidatus Delongbacteria bacterium]|nr:hypothetical protein [Candidatus Delongbacteria bacterium]